MMLTKWLEAVERRASSGQGKNQSIVVQFTSDGNVLSLRLNASPTGENARTKCKFYLQIFTKYLYFSFGVPPAQSYPTSSIIFALSSLGNKFGTYLLLRSIRWIDTIYKIKIYCTSPLLRMLQMSSTIDSFATCVSENKNIVSYIITRSVNVILIIEYL